MEFRDWLALSPLVAVLGTILAYLLGLLGSGTRRRLVASVVLIVLAGFLVWWNAASQTAEQRQLRQLERAEQERRREVAQKLAEFLTTRDALIQRCIRELCSEDVERSANDWYRDLRAYVGQAMGPSYLARLKDVSDMPARGVPADLPGDKEPFFVGLRERVARLHVFIRDLGTPLASREVRPAGSN